MPKTVKNLERHPKVYNVPGVGAVHLAPKGKPGSEQAVALGPHGWGPEIEGALRARPPLVAVSQ